MSILFQEVFFHAGIVFEALQDAVETGFDRVDRQFEGQGDFVEGQAIDETHQKHFPLIVGQVPKGFG